MGSYKKNNPKRNPERASDAGLFKNFKVKGAFGGKRRKKIRAPI